VVIQAVPALTTIIGTFASVTTGALAIASGEKMKPISRLTWSCVISSVTSVLAPAPVGGPESRLIISILSAPSSLPWSLK
jgi:hypothetical protein